jgi:hypothetical protein
MKEEKSKVGELNDSLYSRTKYVGPNDRRSSLQNLDTTQTPEDWPSENIDSMLKRERRTSPAHPFMKRLFIFALVFCLGAGGLAAYIYFGGGNLISSKNVDITVLGPVNVSAGGTVDLDVTITNKNNADLALTNMTVDYPEGTKDPEDITKTLSHTKFAIGDLGAGKFVVEHEHAALFGQTGDIKQIKITVEYQVKGSNATFDKEKIYEVALGTSPVTIQVGQPSTVTSGDTFTTTLTVLANSTDVLKNVIVRGEYPYGYTVVSSSPTPVSADNNSWSLGDLASGDKKTISIKGVLSGEDQDERTFRFYTGVGNAETGTLDTALTQVSRTVSLNRPGVNLALSFNGESSDPYVAPAGNGVTVNINYQNNLPQNLVNPKIVATLSGASLDKFSVVTQGGGFYNSSDNTITWDQTNDPSLGNLAPGDKGNVTFNFASQNNLALNTKNPEITLSVNMSGVPQGLNSSNAVSVSEKSSVRLASQVTLASKALYSRGPFKNTGPLPPQAEKVTSYTIVFDLGNTQNEVSGGKVTATLGPNVSWLSTASSTEDITYDQTANKVTWNVGTLSTGAGFSVPGREGTFQVSLSPSIGQVGTVPILVTGITFNGTDTFTKKTVSVVNSAVTTRVSTDPKYVQGDEQVVK